MKTRSRRSKALATSLERARRISPFKDNIDFSLSTFPIAGKTGTATNGGIGIEPSLAGRSAGDALCIPKYVVAPCVIDEGGYGADAAAPVRGEDLQLSRGAPDRSPEAEAHPDDAYHDDHQAQLVDHDHRADHDHDDQIGRFGCSQR